MASGLDALVSSMLSARVDELIGAVSASGSSTTAQTTTTQTGAAVATPSGAAPAAQEQAAAPAPAVETSLSQIAMTLDAISRLGGDALAPVQGQAPLWPTPPPAPAAASGTPNTLAQNTPATAQRLLPAALLETTLALDGDTAASGTADAAAAASAAAALADSAPTGLAVSLAGALVQALESSGLFYESHLAQWVMGTRASADLQREPQAQSATRQLTLDFLSDSEKILETGYSTLPASNTGSDSGTDAASSAGTPSSGSASAMPRPDIDPSILPLVRQQLDMLSTPQPVFRWSGEAWPGTKFDWEVEPYAAQGQETQEPHGAWRTRITLDMPSLGPVDTELVLTGRQLLARIRATPDGAAALLHGSENLRRRIAAAGLDLHKLSIREQTSNASAGVTP